MELDPNNDLFIYQQGINLRYARDYDDAYEALQIALSFKPAASNVHMQIAFTEIARGNREEALRKLDIAEQLLVESNLDRYRAAQFAFGYSQLDRHDDVMRMFNRLTEIDQSDPIDDALWAMMYLALGDHEQALLHLEQAIDVQDPNIFTLAELKANAYQMPVLDEPRFRSLLDQVGVFD
jgi:tetratricopeptide (TPR) repeat protein